MRKLKEVFRSALNKYNGIPLIAIGVIVVLMIISGGEKQTEYKEEADDVLSQSEITESKFENDEDEVLTIYGIKEIKIDEGSAEAELQYLNPEQNSDRYYIRVSVILKETGETVYSSELIPPGQGIDRITLSRTFEKGTYPAVFHIQGYKMNDLSSAKGADLDIDIIVK